MQEQIKNIGGEPMDVKNLEKNPLHLFNVRFKLEDLSLYYLPKELPKSLIKNFRYKFLNTKKNMLELEKNLSNRKISQKENREKIQMI